MNSTVMKMAYLMHVFDIYRPSKPFWGMSRFTIVTITTMSYSQHRSLLAKRTSKRELIIHFLSVDY